MQQHAALPPGVDPDQPVAQIGPDEPLTQQQFADEFDRAMRGLAMQHGWHFTDELRAEFDRFRGEFLEQWATQQALVREAEERGLEALDAEVDAAINLARTRWGEEFDQRLAELGFEDETAYRDAVREGVLAQQVIDELRAEVQWTEEELREFHGEHRDRFFHGREFDEARTDVEQRFVSEQLRGQFRDLRAQHGIEVFPDRLRVEQPVGLGAQPGEEQEGDTFVGERPEMPGVDHHRRVTLPPGIDPDEPVVHVGPDQVLTQQQFAEMWDRATRGLALELGPLHLDEVQAAYDRLRHDLLEAWATQQALLFEAEQRGIEIPDEDVDAQVEQARERLGDRFDEMLVEVGFPDEEAYREALREGMLAQRVLDDLRAEVEWTDEELREWHEWHRGRYFDDEELDVVRPEAERLFVAERLQERFQYLRGQQAIETFPERLRIHEPIETN